MRRRESEEHQVLLSAIALAEEERREEVSFVLNPFFQKERELESLMTLEFFM